MSHPDVGQGSQGTGSEEPSAGGHLKQDRPGGPEIGLQPGNGGQQMMANSGSNTHMVKQGPGPSPMPQHTGASPQQQLASQPQQGGPIPGLHFPNVPTTSQSSRPKTPNRASPRPYHHPLTPTNRPPSTEPSEINLSPERLNASIAGLFPPKINIPLPPRQPNLSRGFDQQGLNPTTLKAIGQAPPNLTLPNNNNNNIVGGNNTTSSQQPFSTGTGTAGAGAKQDKQPAGQSKRASPSNSRRSSPASSRKSATPSPGRQKGTKMAITCPPPPQLVNPQGQTMMLSPTSVPPSPVSMPSQVSGSVEAQQAQSPFHVIPSNPVEGARESQVMMPTEQRPIPQPQPSPQPLRELSAPRMASPRFPVSQQAKPDLELQAGTVDRQLVHAAPTPDSEVSPTHRTAPTSLNQLLDNAGLQNMPIRALQSSTVRDGLGKDSSKAALDSERTLHCTTQNTDLMTSVATTATINEPEAISKGAVSISTSSPNLQPASVSISNPSINVNSNTTPSLHQNTTSTLGNNPNPLVNPSPTLCPAPGTNTNSSTSPNTVTSGQSIPASTISTSSSSTLNPTSSALKPNPSPKPVTSAHSVIQIPASSTISPNQITVFVTSNPITSAPTPQAPTSVGSNVVPVPNKNMRPQDIRQQTPVPRTPQFITTTPVFINPIFQVPGVSVAPNTTVVSHSVTMMGPIQVSTANIQLSAAPTSTQSSAGNMTSTQLARSTGGQVQIATSVSSPAPVGTLPASQQINQGAPKTENQSETGSLQKTGPQVQQPSPHPVPPASSPFQPPMVSTPPCSSPGAVSTVRKSPMSPPPTAQMKNKPLQAVVGLTSTSESQQSLAERSAQGLTGAAQPQIFHPSTTSAIQIEAQAPHATTSPSNISLPAVSSPIPVPGQVAILSQISNSQTPVLAPTSVSSPVKAGTSQPPIVTIVGTTTNVSSATLLSTVAPVQSTVPSVVPIVAGPGPGPISDVRPTTSSPVPNLSGAPPCQSDPPPMEPTLPPAAAHPEMTQTAPGNHTIPNAHFV